MVGLRDISVGALVEPGDLITTLDDDSVMKLDLGSAQCATGGTGPRHADRRHRRAFGDREFHGEIRGLDSRVDPVTRSVQVRALLPNPARLLKPGLLMQVTLRKHVRETLVIPEAALMPLGRDQFVLVAVPSDGAYKAEKREIRIGSRRPGEVEVLEGLQAGERVITHGTMQVRPGQAVAIRVIDDGTRPLTEILKTDVTAGRRE